MDQEARERIESYELSDDFDFPKLMRDEEETEYKTESEEIIPPADFDSPEIADAFIDDKLDIITQKIKTVDTNIQKNYLMRSNYVKEIDEEIALERKDLTHIIQFNIEASKILADRRRSIETRMEDLRKRKRDTKEHFTDVIFKRRMERLDLMPEYLSLKRIKGVLSAGD
jgi:hypothetical protein